MITHLTAFILNLAELTEPFCVLTAKHAVWAWTEQHQNSFQLLKEQLLPDTILAYFNPDAPMRIVTDASHMVLVLQQQLFGENRPVSFASRALTPVECCYSQIE